MANETIGLNLGKLNPYSVTVTGSGTLVSSDIELVYNLGATTPITKEDILLALDTFKQFIVQSLGPGAETMSAPPP